FGKRRRFAITLRAVAQGETYEDILCNRTRARCYDKRVRDGNIDGPIVDSCHYDGAFVHEPIAQLIAQTGSAYAVRRKMKSEL
ncbi:MAG: hypothetical protein HP492_11415, partial [Nitrospira sp.]|nr:hypothetical protein [Nitrospira sp.]